MLLELSSSELLIIGDCILVGSRVVRRGFLADSKDLRAIIWSVSKINEKSRINKKNVIKNCSLNKNQKYLRKGFGCPLFDITYLIDSAAKTISMRPTKATVIRMTLSSRRDSFGSA